MMRCISKSRVGNASLLPRYQARLGNACQLSRGWRGRYLELLSSLARVPFAKPSFECRHYQALLGSESEFDYHYRVGVYCDSETIEFLRVGTREDFSKKFP
jgi:hypothetical protein